VRGKRFGKGLGEHVHARFGSHIGEVAARACEARDGRHVNNEPVARSLEQRRKGADGREHAAQIGLHDVVKQRVRQAVQVSRRHGLGVACAVYQDVAAPRLLADGQGGGLQGSAVSDRGGERKVRPTGHGGQCGQQCLHLLAAAAVNRHDASAERRQTPRACQANGPFATGEHGDAAVEAVNCFKTHGGFLFFQGMGGWGKTISPACSTRS
jgi:hypothetical protein